MSPSKKWIYIYAYLYCACEGVFKSFDQKLPYFLCKSSEELIPLRVYIHVLCAFLDVLNI